jgi:hypothetical protein
MNSTASTDMIEVDGVSRPRFNSNGDPIHSTEEGIRNFWKWFGDSKLIDTQGRPRVFYHGTDANFTEFSTSTIGQAQDGKLFAGAGFYFADNQHDASGYGANVMATYLKSERLLDMRDKEAFIKVFQQQIPRDQEKTLGEMMRVYSQAVRQLDIQAVSVTEERPGFFDVQWKIAGNWHSNWPHKASSLELSDDPTGWAYARRQALPKNPDEFLNAAAFSIASIDAAIRGVFDGVIADGSIGHSGDEYMVYNPRQIKSATGNNGDFNPATSNIYDAESPVEQMLNKDVEDEEATVSYSLS